MIRFYQRPATVTADTVVKFEEPAEDPVYHSELYHVWTKTLPGSSRSVTDTAWYYRSRWRIRATTLQNDDARIAWERNTRRPYVTIVYIGPLTGRPARKDEEAYVAEREDLEGLAVAQYEQKNHPASDHNSALLNVVIANAGYQMKYVGQVVGMVADLARSDPTVVAVTVWWKVVPLLPRRCKVLIGLASRLLRTWGRIGSLITREYTSRFPRQT